MTTPSFTLDPVNLVGVILGVQKGEEREKGKRVPDVRVGQPLHLSFLAVAQRAGDYAQEWRRGQDRSRRPHRWLHRHRRSYRCCRRQQGQQGMLIFGPIFLRYGATLHTS